MAQLMSIKRNVEMCPGQVSVPAIYHVSQGDKGTRIILGLVNNSANYTIPEGTTATIRGHRADGTLFTEIMADVETTEVKFNLTEDMSAVPGRAECEAVLASGSANIIGTANFIIDVEKSPASIGSVFPGTDAAETWLIDELTNLDISGLDNESVVGAINSKANESTIAPEFDTSTSYTAGQYVYKNGVLYRFTAAHSGAWTGTDAETVTVGGELTNTKTGIDCISTVGMNMFDKDKAKQGYYAKATDGDVTARNGFYVSDFIQVEPETSYYIARGLGSSTFITVAFYDSSKSFLSGSYCASTSRYTVTTPLECLYIRINGSIAYINNQSVSQADINSILKYQRIIDGKNDAGVMLIASSDIFYDYESGTLKSRDGIHIITPDGLNYGFSSPVNVGQGTALYWNKKTNTLYASTTIDISENVYFIAWLNNIEYRGAFVYSALVSAFPMFEIDLNANTLNIKNVGASAYIIHGNKHYTIATGYTQTIENLPTMCAIIYDPVDVTFKISTNIDTAAFEGIPILFRNYRSVSGITGANINTPIHDFGYKNVVCYGDSLTWYDGKAFTWGPHQGETCIGFETYLLNELDCRNVSNRGESGKTTSEICSKIVSQASQLTNFDYMTIMGGDNDDRLDASVGNVYPVGSAFDTTTVCGALQNAIETSLRANPSLRIILMTEPMGWTYQNGALDRVSDLIPNAYRNVAKQYGLPLVDLWNESGINELTRNAFYADPPDTENNLYMYHPNNDGWKRLSKIIVNRIKEIG